MNVKPTKSVGIKTHILMIKPILCFKIKNILDIVIEPSTCIFILTLYFEIEKKF